jgi:hypothetical protein
MDSVQHRKDPPNVSAVTPAEDFRTVLINNVSWGAVLAGAVVAIMTQVVLNTLGVALGAFALDAAADRTANFSEGDMASGAATFSLVAAIWWTVSGVIAAFIGGYAAGRLSGRPKESTGGWHGVATWGVTMIAVFYILTSAVGGLIGGAFGQLSQGVGREVVSQDNFFRDDRNDAFSPIAAQIREATGQTDPQALGDLAVASVLAVVTAPSGQADAFRARAVQNLARVQGVSEDQARAQLNSYEQQFSQASAQARETVRRNAEIAAEATSRAAFFSFIALIIGAAAAWLGGWMGAVNPTLTASKHLWRRGSVAPAE